MFPKKTKRVTKRHGTRENFDIKKTFHGQFGTAVGLMVIKIAG